MKGRRLTLEDMKGSEHKLPFMSKFDTLVEVCRVAAELYDQENKSNEGGNGEAFDVEKSWGKRPVGRADHEQESGKAALLSSRSCCVGVVRVEGESSSGFRGGEIGFDHGKRRKYCGCEDFDQNYGGKEKVFGKKRTYCGSKDEDFEYCEETEEFLGKKRTYCGSKDEDFEYCEEKEEVLGKKRTYCGSKDEDFEYCEEKEKVLGKKRTYCGSKDEDFEYCEKKEKVLGKKRTYCGSKDEDFEYSVKKEKRARRNNLRVRSRVVEAAALPGEFADEILRLGGCDVKLLIQKNITATDLNPGENRFSIPVNQVREEGKDFLTEAEKKTLDRRNADNRIVPIPVRVLEPNLKRSCINFKKWPMNSSFSYVLCGSWTGVQRNNHLEANREIQVWSFRVNGELNLALVKVPEV